ncbi:hypothetical protein PTTG_00217 [Puccinia triticina 1-1 BBBD Race 1]|uniref:Uncharacterized protein n=1 Tax=Puccinia triticina (isolate 1-1 / race 1 (BBBD)) TaxID=630390 RepID=A0A0C4EHK1_PUCT1|nr:hypothetical protein PTTG_00217 [Puccinia triticina 1-1 BBBD Race 1]
MDASKATKLQQKLADITKKTNKEEKKHHQAKANLEDALRKQNPAPSLPTTGEEVATIKAPKAAQPNKFNGKRRTAAEMFARQVGIYMTLNKALFPMWGSGAYSGSRN